MKYQFQGKQYPTIQAMVLAVNPIINAWPDEQIELFYVVLPFDRRSITDIMRGEYRCDACGWSAPSHEDLTYSNRWVKNRADIRSVKIAAWFKGEHDDN